MKVLVTGATGFIGRHIVQVLIERGHDVIAVSRNQEKAEGMDWYDNVTYISCDIHQLDQEPKNIFGCADAVIHSAWPGLPHYSEMFHFEKNLPADFNFIKNLVLSGYQHILVTGTCFEYGMQNGCLKEDTVTRPENPYGLAKDSLRKYLQVLQRERPFILQWTRLFYVYGEGQNPNSILAQLEQALANRDEYFNMSGGEQLRDYLPVQEAAKKIVALLEHPACEGIINICSGKPISIRNLVENHLKSKGKKIKLKLGYYPYSSYEPMAFWGDISKYENCMK